MDLRTLLLFVSKIYYMLQPGVAEYSKMHGILDALNYDQLA